MDAKKKIFSIISDNLEMENELTGSESFDDLEIDSILFISIVVSIEEEFDIEFDDTKLDISEFSDIDSVCHYVQECLKVR